MMTHSHVSDVTEADFQEKVLVRSRTVPVLVDFWAPWCEPCKTLGPVLEKLADEYAGQFELAKVDVEQFPRIGAAMRVQSVPTVYLIKDGQPVDGFVGGQPESAVRALLERHVEPPAGDPLVMAEEALQAGRLDAALGLFTKVIEDQPENMAATMGLTRIFMLKGAFEDSGKWLSRLPQEDAAVGVLGGLLNLPSLVGDEAELRKKVADDTSDVDGWFRLGATLWVAGEMQGSIEAFLKVVSLDREYLEDGGRKTLLGIFQLLGPEEPRVISGRRKLAGLLF